MNILNIPIEVVEKISEHLDHKTYENFRLTCSYIKNCLHSCENANKSWKKCNGKYKNYLKKISDEHFKKNIMLKCGNNYYEFIEAIKNINTYLFENTIKIQIKFTPKNWKDCKLFRYVENLSAKILSFRRYSVTFSTNFPCFFDRKWEISFYINDYDINTVILSLIDIFEKDPDDYYKYIIPVLIEKISKISVINFDISEISDIAKKYIEIANTY